MNCYNVVEPLPHGEDERSGPSSEGSGGGGEYGTGYGTALSDRGGG